MTYIINLTILTDLIHMSGLWNKYWFVEGVKMAAVMEGDDVVYLHLAHKSAETEIIFPL